MKKFTNFRKNFGKLRDLLDLPDLVELQTASYKAFFSVCKNGDATKGSESSLDTIFRSVFPIMNNQETVQVEYLGYRLEKPKNDFLQSLYKGKTYESVLYINLVLKTRNTSKEKWSVKQKQEIYLGSIPIMTDFGSFVINGTERVVVNQLNRSAGILFSSERDPLTGRGCVFAKIMPVRGSWIEFRLSTRGSFVLAVDLKKIIPVASLMRVMDIDYSVILDLFKIRVKCRQCKDGWLCSFANFSNVKKYSFNFDILDPISREVILEKGNRAGQKVVDRLKKLENREFFLPFEQIVGQYLATDLIDGQDKEKIFLRKGMKITPTVLSLLIGKKDIPNFFFLVPESLFCHMALLDNFSVDYYVEKKVAFEKIAKAISVGEISAREVNETAFKNIFSNPSFYNLGEVGRLRLNEKLGLKETAYILTTCDVIAVIRCLVSNFETIKDDDIDSLLNRKIRGVGELLGVNYYAGVTQMVRFCKERLSLIEISEVTLKNLINFRFVVSAVRDFFTSSQLCQFMDQTNPLSELTHKRRLSSLGPRGLIRERAGFEVRDVHPSYYGRVCPIETPEGQNIGLINSLACYSIVDKYGFIETPYCYVEKGRRTQRVDYLTAKKEQGKVIAQASEINVDGSFKKADIVCRKNYEVLTTSSEKVDYVAISPKQVVSVAAALIPFIENDDANRALMGSNMQRQAVNLISCETPLVSTGVEKNVARASATVLRTEFAGVVKYVDSKKIVLVTERKDTFGVRLPKIYSLRKFARSNNGTCINYVPSVYVGQRIKKGDVLANGPATDNGELALGKNLLVAFMPWMGYNFEDSVLISERLVREDLFSSIHIEEFEATVRNTKLGLEEITNDIPNVSEGATRNLDSCGIISLGARVSPRDVLVGKITPKGEVQMTPEEKLIRVIFGTKSEDVKDSSLKVPPGVHGTVVDVRIFTANGVKKCDRLLKIEKEKEEEFKFDYENKVRIYRENAMELIESLVLQNKKDLSSSERNNSDLKEKIEKIKKSISDYEKSCEAEYNEKVENFNVASSLPVGVLMVIKVFVAVKRRIRIGDKIAGRHGNKGVVSHILNDQDLPYLEDGTPVDIVLNPLGVPSRMNVGQILETHLGWGLASFKNKLIRIIDANEKGMEERIREELLNFYDNDLFIKEKIKGLTGKDIISFVKSIKNGFNAQIPSFDGASDKEISNLLANSGQDPSGKVFLYDGRSGRRFDYPVTVGYIYIMKLHHLADEKMHTRSVGTYSLVAQQPLGGKAQFGGQRLGEMEVWALEAYGAAYTLREMLTVKSDDISGRISMYSSIVRNEYNFESGVPESFNVLMYELKSLGFSVNFLDKEESIDGEKEE